MLYLLIQIKSRFPNIITDFLDKEVFVRVRNSFTIDKYIWNYVLFKIFFNITFIDWSKVVIF